jgi:hypothetical protein
MGFELLDSIHQLRDRGGLADDADVVFSRKRRCHSNTKDSLVVSQYHFDHADALAIWVPQAGLSL